jgi:hypothetical protein
VLESTEAQFESEAELRRQAAQDKAAAAPPVPVVRARVPNQQCEGAQAVLQCLVGGAERLGVSDVGSGGG